jgi:hypothetical protein
VLLQHAELLNQALAGVRSAAVEASAHRRRKDLAADVRTEQPHHIGGGEYHRQDQERSGTPAGPARPMITVASHSFARDESALTRARA